MKNGFQLSEIKDLLQKKLGELRFVQKADGNDIVFCEPDKPKTVPLPKSTKEKKREKGNFKQFNEGKHAENNLPLKKVVITNIPRKTQIWYLDTWDGEAIQNNKEKLIGLGVGNKLVDGILIFFDNDKQCLNIYFIELKSSLPDSELGKIIEKVKHSISRFLLFLCLNENQHNKKPFLNTRIEFKTILFFNRMADKIDVSEDTELRAITKKYRLMQTDKSKEATCYPIIETLLGETQNPFKFIFREKEEEITISFDDLISF